MSLGVTVLFAWVAATCVVAYAMIKCIENRKPGAHWGSPRQLIWHALAAVIVLAAVYVMLIGSAEGRMVIPGKRTPTQYFHAEIQPIAFWLLLAVEFVLTVAFSAALAAGSFLVLRPSRGSA